MIDLSSFPMAERQFIDRCIKDFSGIDHGGQVEPNRSGLLESKQKQVIANLIALGVLEETRKNNYRYTGNIEPTQ